MDSNLKIIEEIEKIAQRVVDFSFQISKDFGPGLIESVYKEILSKLLIREGFDVKTELPINYEYQGIVFKNDLRLDLLINDKFVVELKATERFNPVYARQLNTYLVLMNLPLGLLVNFGGETLKNNCKRVLNIRHPLAQLLVENSPFETNKNSSKVSP